MTQFGKLILALADGQEQEFVLEKSTIILGRSAASDITLADAKVSRAHARLECSAAGCTLIDLGSANGVRVNGQQTERVLLAPGDVISLGVSTIRFAVEAPTVAQEEIVIDSAADLDLTLAQATVPMTVANTDLPRLVIHTPDRTWDVPLTQETFSIGRQGDSDLVLNQANTSRHHARIERVGAGFRLRDLGSTNGTWLGSQRIDERLLRNGDTIRIGSTQLLFKGGFNVEELTFVEEPLPSQFSSRTSSRPPVVFVPGMMGSELWRGSERLWPNVKALFTQPEIYRLRENDGIEARGVVGEVVLIPNFIKQQHYNRLGDYLVEALGYERGNDLLEFGYDCRQDNRHSARRLAATIEQWPVAGPITLIAHSLGCIVSRYYIERLGGKHRVGRLILLGGPHAGYPKAISHLMVGLDLLPFGLYGERLRRVITTFPSLYQILPTTAYVRDQTGQPIDVLSDASWLAAEQRPLLHDAHRFRQELGSQTSVPTVSIFGYGLKTIAGMQIRRTPTGQWEKIDFDHDEVGDTDIPTSSAVLAGSEIHPVQQHHGSLYVDNDVKMRLKVELMRGM